MLPISDASSEYPTSESALRYQGLVVLRDVAMERKQSERNVYRGGSIGEDDLCPPQLECFEVIAIRMASLDSIEQSTCCDTVGGRGRQIYGQSIDRPIR